jgi:predicted enzyme related to lactoylglutathione lyase
MSAYLFALTIEAQDPQRLAAFWADLLGRTPDAAGHRVALVPGDDTGFRLTFAAAAERPWSPHQIHFHLTSSSLEDQQHTVQKALDLGARHLDVGQLPEEGHIVLADPEGNEFCVIEPGNNYLAGCGFFAELACDGTQQVGSFWSAALEWPLVWEQDEETAIRAPDGGPKISWGGPPVREKTEPNSMHFDLALPDDGDIGMEVERLISLGASRAENSPCALDWVGLTDPDGNEFCVMAPR